ncbi:hypothetical protein RFF05_09895 [Bengtsoniella intestinalis]|uniref:HAMP domain-containing protein n=1 Tax=Bengtsoniella intestinalis TaxID=3073143 RepID=UPI00391FA41F
MKKVSITVVLILACLGIALYTLPMPQTETLQQVVALDDRSGYLAIETVNQTHWIYEIDTTGAMISARVLDFDDQECYSWVEAMAQAGDDCYLLLGLYDTNAVYNTTWQLWHMDVSDYTLTNLGNDNGLYSMVVKDMILDGAGVSVAGINDDQQVQVISWDETTWTLTQLISDVEALSLYYNDDVLTIQTLEGDWYRNVGESLYATTSLSGNGASEVAGFDIELTQTWSGLLSRGIYRLAVMGIVIGLGLLLWVFAVKYQNLKLISLRLMVVTVVTPLVVLAILIGALFQMEATQTMNHRLTFGQETTAQKAQWLGQIEGVSRLGVLSAEDVTLLGEHDTLMTAQEILYSSTMAQGTLVEGNFDQEILDMMEDGLRGYGDAATIAANDRLWVVAVEPVYAGTQVVALLMSTYPVDTQTAVLQPVLEDQVMTLVLMTMICLLFAIWNIWRSFRSMDKLVNQMEHIAQGNYATHLRRQRLDELGSMHTTLQELCMGLSIRDYEINATLQSYQRFIPRGVDQLLGCANVTDIDVGDAQMLEGAVALMAVSNRGKARSSLSDRDYVDFISRSFAQVETQVGEGEGQLLASGFQPAFIPALFPQGVASGCDMGLRLMGSCQDEGAASKGVLQPAYSFILHYSKFLYGVGGTKGQVFPFISSAELIFLSGYSQSLYKAGVQMVMTHVAMEQLGASYAKRYIGFVSMEQGKTFQLYELLGGYSDIVRNQRLRYDSELQKGIALFYKADFFLARTCFSQLLKSCPDDGIARWYLFACEERLRGERVEDLALFSTG